MVTISRLSLVYIFRLKKKKERKEEEKKTATENQETHISFCFKMYIANNLEEQYTILRPFGNPF